jgi:hypothetical protein
MAFTDVDQKYLGRIAQRIETRHNAYLAESLYQILGLSVVLSRKLYRARRLRRLDPTRDTRSLQLYHQIVWLSREGLSVLEHHILPLVQAGQYGPQLQVLALHLRASFIHNFCLFHNKPSITIVSGGVVPSSSDYSPPSPRAAEYAQAYDAYVPAATANPARQSHLRDPINSMISDTSFVTNPYAGIEPSSSPSLGPVPVTAPSVPPGLGTPVSLPNPASFLFPARDFVPDARGAFVAASAAATALLPGAHPLRLTVAIEHAAFIWDCVHDHNGARQLARRAIRQLRDREEQDFPDEAFEDAAVQVQYLGRIMRRRSMDSTPRTTQGGSTGSSTGNTSAIPSGVVLNNINAPRHSRRTSQTEQRRSTNVDSVPGFAGSIPGSRTRAGSTSVPISALPAQPPTGKLPTPPRSSRQRDTYAPPSIEGGPVGGLPPARRRESTRGRTGSNSNGVYPQPVAPVSSRQRSGTTSRRSAPVAYDPATPPRPPPKDASYTPSTPGSKPTPTRRTILQPQTPTKRPSTSKGKERKFNGSEDDPERYGYDTRYAVQPIDSTVNSAYVPTGYYTNSATDQRGKGDR